MTNRIKRIFSNSDKKVDAFIIVNSDNPNLDPNFFYLSGITSGVFEGCAVIGYRNGKGHLLTSQLEEPIARKESKLKISVFEKRDERKEQIKKLLSGINKLGINGRNLSYKQYKAIKKLTKAKIVDVSDAFSKTRSIKDKEEIKLISRACKISAQAANEFPNYVRLGITEKELSKKLLELQYKFGATNLAFLPPIVAFGKNSSRPHHTPTDRKLKKNEFILIDFGAEYNRYASDISRTFVFGKANRKMKEIYETVKEAQQKGIDMVRDDVNGKDIDKMARDMIDKKFKGSFIHSLGHEVGMLVHDGNVLSPQVDFTLKEKMVVTIEPGIYIPTLGGVRIEDTVLITKHKAKVLTGSSKNLIEI